MTLFSCSKNKNTVIEPVINIVSDSGYITNGATVVPGTRMSFKLMMSKGSEELTNFYVELASGNQPAIRYFDTAMYAEQLTWTGHFYKSSNPEDIWSFVVRDRKGGSSQVTLNILADTGWVYSPLLSLSNIKLGGQGNAQYGGFYSLNEQMVFDLAQAFENQQHIDLVYYHGDDELTMASAGANIEAGIFPEDLTPVNWEIRNTTRFIKTNLNNEIFDEVTNDSILIALYVEDEGKRKAKNLVDGDVYVFMDHQNSLGLFRVNTTSGVEEGFIDLDIKIQIQGK